MRSKLLGRLILDLRRAEPHHAIPDSPWYPRRIEAWLKVSNGPLCSHGYAGECRPSSAAELALASWKIDGKPKVCVYNAAVPAVASDEMARAVREVKGDEEGADREENLAAC